MTRKEIPSFFRRKNETWLTWRVSSQPSLREGWRPKTSGFGQVWLGDQILAKWVEVLAQTFGLGRKIASAIFQDFPDFSFEKSGEK